MRNAILGSTVVFLLSLAGASHATPISFTNAGALDCGSNASCTELGPNQLQFASTGVGQPALVVTYVAGGDTAETPPAASANFGAIALACAACTTANSASWDITGASGVVTFSQTLPSIGSGAMSGTFSSAALGWSGSSGASGGQTGFGLFTWDVASVTISDGVSEPGLYSVFGPAVLLQLGNNSIQGLVNVPEPASLTLLGAGLLALRRRARSRASRLGS
jgi:hypothetical protein